MDAFLAMDIEICTNLQRLGHTITDDGNNCKQQEQQQTSNKIDAKDEERTLIFGCENPRYPYKNMRRGNVEEFKTKYQLIDDKKRPYILNKGGDGIICKVKNNPDLIAKHNNGQTLLGAFWRQYCLMKCTNILYYENFFIVNLNKSIFIMEKLSYTLNEYIKQQNTKQTMREKDAKLIIFDIINCLYKIHITHTGHIHCDIKPQNIMYRNCSFIGSDGMLYKKGWVIIDYNSMIPTTINGVGYYSNDRATFGWCSPEIIQHINSVNIFKSKKIFPSTDLWNIGLIILFILFKKQPFQFAESKKKGFWTDFFGLNLTEIELIQYLVNLKKQCLISNKLYKLLRYRLLVYDNKKRMNSVEELYDSSWFDDIRTTNDINGECMSQQS
eukprot:231987_1